MRRNLARKSNWEKIIHFCPRCIFAANFASGHFGANLGWGFGFCASGLGFGALDLQFRGLGLETFERLRYLKRLKRINQRLLRGSRKLSRGF